MTQLELIVLVSGVACYALAFISSWIKKAKAAVFLILGIVAQAVSVGIRWYGIGHPPVFGTYEAALAGSWFMLLYTAFSYKSIHGHFRSLILTTVPIAILIIIYGLTFNTERIPLTISERSLWVDFHAMFSWIAFGSYTTATCLAGAYLWQGARGKGQGGEDSAECGMWNADSNSSPDVLDDLIFRYINWGFITHTVMFAIGSYYSSILYGNWWQWDPVNSTSLITWLAYGLAIHMRLFYGWKGRRGANLAIVCFLTAIVSYWGLIYFPPGSTYHVFDLELKSH